jgi:hypothetical protein
VDRSLLEVLSPVFNDLHVEHALNKYVEYRLKQLNADIEREEDTHKIYRIQGSITEVKKLLELRLRINDKVKELRND